MNLKFIHKMNLKSITKLGANRRLFELSIPENSEEVFDKDKWKLNLAVYGLEPSFDDPNFISTVCTEFGWKQFGSSKARKLRELVCRAIFSKVVDFSRKDIDEAFAKILPDILLNESNGKTETAMLFEVLIQHAPEQSVARSMALRLNHAFGLTSVGISKQDISKQDISKQDISKRKKEKSK